MMGKHVILILLLLFGCNVDDNFDEDANMTDASSITETNTDRSCDPTEQTYRCANDRFIESCLIRQGVYTWGQAIRCPCEGVCITKEEESYCLSDC
ncbi:hypothetical protein KKG22_02560 [Patescibacteria group bacterium]|nr:hypothetical protein [Patescibacteria group bacterium]MBU1722184.1 hypothetical protein [Patescibacteria group bacterium]MBU1901135.1 hypothetical protein [Patescibacteria group bacterium]